MISVAARILRGLASLHLTLVCVVAAAVIAALGQSLEFPVGTWIAGPFAILFVNLIAAILVNRKLSQQAGLLGFHLALALLALLVAYDGLASLDGHVEITEGAAFDPALVTGDAGPLHRSKLDRIRFVQGGFSVAYAPGMKRRETLSTVYLPTRDRGWRSRIIGDEHPLSLLGYNFYTSFNKGFAPVLTFIDERGAPHTGAVHLPSYPLNYYKQGNSWTPPGTTQPVKLWLHLGKQVFREDEAWQFAKPERATLVIMNNGDRYELHAGEAIPLNGGSLRFDEVRSWMGYTISHNPALPWILAAAAIGVLSLAWHFFTKFRACSWRSAEEERQVEHAR